MVFNKKEGRITSYQYKGNGLIKDGKGPKPNFWRAVTDNDSGNGMYNSNIEWKKASLFSKVIDFTVKKIEDNVVQFNVTYNLPGVETFYHSTYLVNGNGIVEVKNTLDITYYIADIPRIGMRIQLPKEFSQITYFGRGPWENYQDRNVSVFVDLYESNVKDRYVPYIRPQENGYKTDVRWVALSNTDGDGLLVVSINIYQGLGISALHMLNQDFDSSESLDYGDSSKVKLEYRIDGVPDINDSKHTIDIEERDLVQLNIDLAQRGVGGDDSWDTKPQKIYLLYGDRQYTYSYVFIPFINGDK